MARLGKCQHGDITTCGDGAGEKMSEIVWASSALFHTPWSSATASISLSLGHLKGTRIQQGCASMDKERQSRGSTKAC